MEIARVTANIGVPAGIAAMAALVALASAPRHGRTQRPGHGPRRYARRRMLAQGDLRLIALALIAEQPRHGYEIIKLLEEKTSDWYSPSPGIVYPTLTYLEEAGYVTGSTEGAKKLYAITEEGRAYLKSQSRRRRRRTRPADGAWRTGQPLAPRCARRTRQPALTAAAGAKPRSIICAKPSASAWRRRGRPKRAGRNPRRRAPADLQRK